MELNISTQWLDWLIRKLWEITLRKSLNRSIKKSIILLERNAKIETPVRTWLLRNSYETKFEDLTWTLRNFREYAPAVHFWYWQRPNPFMERAVAKTEWNIQKIFENDLYNLLDKLVD